MKIVCSLSASDFRLSNSTAGRRADTTTATIPTVLSVFIRSWKHDGDVDAESVIEASVINLEIVSGDVKDASGNSLNGEWTVGAGSSGNATEGGDFRFVMNVLPGDVIGAVPDANYTNVEVNLADLTSVNNAQTGFMFDPFGIFGSYSIFADVNGTGDSVDTTDVVSVRDRVGAKLLKPIV